MIHILIHELLRTHAKGAQFSARGTDETSGYPAVAVLGERYARGEINEDEYRQRLEVLREQQS